MKIVCSWCRQEGLGGLLGDREPLDDPTETHGICTRHAAEVRDRLPSTSFPGVRVLIVVQRTEVSLYDYLLRSVVGLPDVAVILDRRRADRRRAVQDVSTERRRVNRRVRNTIFSSLGYFVVRFGPGRAPALIRP